MSPRTRHLAWCVVFLVASAAFVVTGLSLGFGIGWDLSQTVSNESTIYQGQRTGPAWAVIPGLIGVGAVGLAIGFFALRLPVEPLVEADRPTDDDWDDDPEPFNPRG